MTPQGARAAAPELDESMVAAGDLWQYGPDADPDPKNVGTMALLSFYVDPEGAVSLDIYGGRRDEGCGDLVGDMTGVDGQPRPPLNKDLSESQLGLLIARALKLRVTEEGMIAVEDRAGRSGLGRSAAQAIDDLERR